MHDFDNHSITLKEHNKFNAVIATIYKDTAFSSDPCVCRNHESYKILLAMGEKAVYLMLMEMITGNQQWMYFCALTDITKARPKWKHEDNGKLDKISKAWLKWGADNNYIMNYAG